MLMKSNIDEKFSKIVNCDNERRAGNLIILFFFIIVIGGMAFIPLDAASIGAGKLTILGGKQDVQTQNGGVVERILVQEGQFVAKGQLLVKLSGGEAEASVRSLSNQFIRLHAIRARLEAELLGSQVIKVPPEFAALNSAERDLANQAIKLQQLEMKARKQMLAASAGLNRERAQQSLVQSSGFQSREASSEAQIKSIDEQLEAMAPLAEKGFVSKNRLRELERLRSALQGELGQSSAAVDQAKSASRATYFDNSERNSSFIASTGRELREVELLIADVSQKLEVARSELTQKEVKAPESGKIVGLSVSTIGGVLMPGQSIVHIVPQDRKIIVEARFAPTDVDDLQVGQAAEVRITGLYQSSIGPIIGQVSNVSAASFVDERTGQEFFVAQITVPESKLQDIMKLSDNIEALRSGMPVEVLVRVRPRTVLAYLLEPLSRQFWRSMREE